MAERSVPETIGLIIIFIICWIPMFVVMPLLTLYVIVLGNPYE
jgi:hypothetical protein